MRKESERSGGKGELSKSAPTCGFSGRVFVRAPPETRDASDERQTIEEGGAVGERGPRTTALLAKKRERTRASDCDPVTRRRAHLLFRERVPCAGRPESA